VNPVEPDGDPEAGMLAFTGLPGWVAWVAVGLLTLGTVLLWLANRYQPKGEP
jgi:hypothetical protein